MLHQKLRHVASSGKTKMDISSWWIKIFNQEKYWNNKWPKSVILYNARGGRPYDVRRFISPTNSLFLPLRSHLKITGITTNDEIALNVLKYIKKNHNYKQDTSEYWMFPEDFYYFKSGDCEDFTNLYVSICRTFGIPAYRIKVCCGWVKNPKGKGLIGHSYPIYLANDDEWKIMDTTYYSNLKDLPIKRVPARNNKLYGKIWFTFNDIHCWRQENHEIETKRFRESVKIEYKK